MNNIDESLEITLELTENELMQIYQEGMPNAELFGHVSIAQGTRKNQQDSSFLNIEAEKSAAVAIVCDGMGGLRGGEIASQTAVKTFVEDFDRLPDDMNDYYDFFEDEVIKIDEKVAGLVDQDGVYLDSGTTLVAVAIKKGLLQWVSVGDSKIYVIRGNEMVCVAKEHTYLNMLNDQLLAGEITEEEYAREQPRGAALTSYIGIGNVSMIERNHEPLKLVDGDIILLCSDGLYKALPEDVIRDIIREDPYAVDETLEKLQRAAAAASTRSQDNTTIIMIVYKK